ncbi:hypothetical protein [Methylobacterium frigidaeris]|uniref:hypothetical protein n=1 Tax=Methylobacterium frigidaeris TaxID=2038277 RepID=UPI001EE06864|nr:hypothetical protein [Methylobacterium frigidaeris]
MLSAFAYLPLAGLFIVGLVTINWLEPWADLVSGVLGAMALGLAAFIASLSASSQALEIIASRADPMGSTFILASHSDLSAERGCHLETGRHQARPHKMTRCVIPRSSRVAP